MLLFFVFLERRSFTYCASFFSRIFDHMFCVSSLIVICWVVKNKSTFWFSTPYILALSDHLKMTFNTVKSVVCHNSLVTYFESIKHTRTHAKQSVEYISTNGLFSCSGSSCWTTWNQFKFLYFLSCNGTANLRFGEFAIFERKKYHKIIQCSDGYSKWGSLINRGFVWLTFGLKKKLEMVH